MDQIFHEKQEGSLCAQHCLNALLQDNYFTAVDLAELAQQLDETERQTMAEAGEQSLAYQQFLEQPSNNFDDSGFFSIQVLQTALRVWNLDLILFNSPDAVAIDARQDPRTQQAYICNFREHWFTVRKLGNQWFNLNSLLSGPELISDTYLHLFLTQLQKEGYSLFIVCGDLPYCEVDRLLRITPAVQLIKPHELSNPSRSEQEEEDTGRDQQFQMALEESRRLVEDDDAALHQAIALSLQDGTPGGGGGGGGGREAAKEHENTASSGSNPSCSTSSDVSQSMSAAELREKRLAYLSKPKPDPTVTVPNKETETDKEEAGGMSEEDSLEAAIKLSMESS